MSDVVELKHHVDALRQTLIGLRGQLAALKAQVRSRREVEALVAQQVAVWGAQAAAEVGADLQRMAAGQTVPLLELRATHGAINLGPWMAAVMGESALSAWLTSLSYNLPEGLDAQSRVDRLLHIAKEIATVEAAEADLLFEAIDLEYDIDPRPDADPRAAVVIGWGEV